MSDAATVMDAWARLFAQRDAKGLAGLYTPQALFYGSNPVLRRGHAQIEDYFQALKGLEAPSVAFEEVALQQLAPGVVDMACVVVFGIGGASVPGRLTWTLVEEAGGWKIASHHASPKEA